MCRTIDEDHDGAGIPFRFGRADDPGTTAAFEAYRARTGRDPLAYFAIGDAASVMARIAAYVDAGVRNSFCALSRAATPIRWSKTHRFDRGGAAADRRGWLREH
jgi:hypothetical protein